MLPDLSPEEKSRLRRVAKEVALEFLQSRLEAVDSKIKRREEELERSYPGGGELPFSEQEVTRGYQKERDLLLGLMEESRRKLFPDLIREHIEAARRRLEELPAEGLDSAKAQSDYYRARRELEEVTELAQEFLDWLQTRREEGRSE